ncbi:MAG: hypothetical protein JL56_07505 [Desulfotomaculum sp. BICA1-6]|nr:MAG: hypothetical protein JL56_07505 [Desulfotomaculum sp. BICA1-6]
MMQVYPEKYDQLELSVDEKSFLRTIERAFSEEEMAYFVLHINPRKKDVGAGKPELFNLLLVSKGILLFRFLNVEEVTPAIMNVKALGNPIVYDLVVTDITKRLEESRYLTDETGKLRFSLNVCFILPKIESLQVLSAVSDSEREFCRNHLIFKDTIMQMRRDGANVIKDYLGEASELQEDLVNNVFQRLCPEITIPRKYILEEHDTVVGVDGKLVTSDRAVQSYRLDSKQIDIINKIAKGNRLILACAGSGKSVLLISKCFKLASLNPNEEFLITCYNRNLNNYYQWAIAQAGFSDRNVLCFTFFGLCRHLLESNGIPIPSARQNRNDYYDRLFEAANNALAQGRIKERFYGFFIDEVQIFRPEWYRFCFNLLKSKNAEDHFFVIAGDKSQDIKNNIKHGKAPWQGGGDAYPEYRGKTLPIETNYRNSKPINDAIDSYVEASKRLASQLQVDLTSDPELFLRGTAYRSGNKPTLVELSTFSNQGEADAIGDAIKNFIEVKGLSEVDIAIILYNENAKHTTKGWQTHYYKLSPYIIQYFNEQGWERPAFLMQGQSEGVTYGSRRGVTVTSIEGSLGLDFRAVVLAGLRPLGTHEKVRLMEEFKKSPPEQITEKREAFKKNINFLYTGCTRAKDELTIILSAPRGESIYMDLLRDSMGGAAI